MGLLPEKRIHFFELHDQTWFPKFMRDMLTDTLSFFWVFTFAYLTVASLLENAMKSIGTTNIVDLCAGAAGPTPYIIEKLNEEYKKDKKTDKYEVILTDLYPNITACERLVTMYPDYIKYEPQPIDATNVPETIKGFRTLHLSFHHFTPELARKILRDAIKQRQGIGIFEITSRSIKGIFENMILTPLIMTAFAPFIKPFSLFRLFFLWVIPILQFFYYV